MKRQIELEIENERLRQLLLTRSSRDDAFGHRPRWIPPHVGRLKASRPNILLVFGDDVGYADIGAFGHPTARTPNLDHMAATGAKLTQYYSAANICSPSRGSLMTGRMYGRLGIFPGVFSPLSNSGLLLNETTVATALKTAKYTTGMLGKWCATI